MKAWLKTLLFSITLILLLANVIFDAHADEHASKPTIEVFGQKPSFIGNYPIKVYIYPEAYEHGEEGRLFECPRMTEVVLALHDALREFHHIVIRFTDEYPQYYRLILIRFANASSFNEADVAVKVVGVTPPKTADFLAYTLYGTHPTEIDILCDANLTYNDYYSNFLHELFHALGLMHAKQPFTDDKSWELMFPGSEYNIKIYPSTLDLYALYIIHFTEFKGEVIKLPEDIEYKMVVPYSYELQVLRQESRQLKDVLTKTQKENYILQGKLRRANSTIESLQRELESTKSSLNDYVKSYNILWLENRDLRNNLSRLYNACNQSISLLASKLNKTYNDYANLTSRYNWLVRTYNNLYQDYQTLREESNDLLQRLYLVGIIAYASLSILLFAYLRVVRKYNKLLSEYDKLVEYLGVGEHGREG